MSSPIDGYADRPIVKGAVWTWEVPVYFFVGGSAGMAGLIAGVVFLFADARGEVESALPIVSRGLWVAIVGAMLSPPLLISDLGRPRRFLNMLRRFNHRSTLSVGVWILVLFSMFASLALWLHGARIGWTMWPTAPAGLEPLLPAALAGLVVLGGLLSTYTGVLLAATVVPAWNRHRTSLPLHFGLSSLAAAGAWLVMLGAAAPALQIMLGAVLIDGALEVWMRWARDQGAELESGWWTPLASTVAALACVAVGLATVAAVVILVAGLIGRFHWVAQGRSR